MLYWTPTFIYGGREGVVEPRTQAFFRHLRKAEGKNLGVGIMGFCFGGLHTFHIAKSEELVDGKRLLDCGFTAHPSGLRVPKDGEEARIPISVIIGDTDFMLSADKAHELKKILEDKSPVEHDEMVILPGAKHGFAIRWNNKSDRENEYAALAENQAVNWFKKQFKI